MVINFKEVIVFSCVLDTRSKLVAIASVIFGVSLIVATSGSCILHSGNDEL